MTNATTPLVSSISQYGMDFSYTYDDVGNITSETREGVTTTYAYDSLGQLTRVNDPHENATWVYNYDLGGNITSKVRYAYTTGTLGAALETIPYSYTDSNWKDKLTAYNGQSITYDAIGNPLNDGTWTYNWEAGRRLAGLEKGNESITYSYEYGRRLTSRSCYNFTTLSSDFVGYEWRGEQLVHVTDGTNEMHFYYDAQNRPAMADFNGTYYTYLHNLQGDIVGLVDSSNNLVVEYKYDAWGRPTLKRSLTTAYDALATLNPFRYRGYIYDEASGLYYLRSRFYNPVWGRFVNADAYVGRRGDMLSHNLFSYCDNRVLICYDASGCGKTYVFYYYFPESKSPLKNEAYNSPYFDPTDPNVQMISVETATDFINSWNAMEGEIDDIYLYLHGDVGRLVFARDNLGINDDDAYSIDKLDEKEINGAIYDFACYGAASADGGASLAVALAYKVKGTVYACDVGVSYNYSFPLNCILGTNWYARTQTSKSTGNHWYKYTYGSIVASVVAVSSLTCTVFRKD